MLKSSEIKWVSECMVGFINKTYYRLGFKRYVALGWYVYDKFFNMLLNDMEFVKILNV